jgi:3-hydroxyacyl-CoA dehydrogenase / enoyl-CoA hydratase / 3-hydroxybutyryl-CoA epimerase
MSSTARHWRLERDGEGIAWLTIDRPDSGANALAREVLIELEAVVASLASNLPRGVVIRSGKANGFIPGADVKEFVGIESESVAYGKSAAGQRVLDQLEALACPTVAAVHGFALGGGLELALACDYIVAVGDDRLALGFPEVMLGIHPGFGGTVRSVRRVGVRPAMDLMLTGRTVRADKAQKLGLVDRLVPTREALEAAARDLIARRPPRHQPPLLERALSWPLVRAFIKPQLVKQVARRVRAEHYPAPYAIIDLWAEYGARGSVAYDAEAQSIARLFRTDAARNLVRVFLLQDRLKSMAGAAPGGLAHVHVVGAGVMGGDIAAWCALNGLSVTLQDRAAEYVQPALTRARELFAKRLRSPARAAEAAARLTEDVAGDGVPRADVVIEAIFENLDAKRELYARLEPRMKPGALLASNTSSIMLEPLAEKLADPGRLVGLHFFNPVAQMPLVEIIRSRVTSDAAVAAALAFTRELDKLPLPCHSSPGFVVNRVLVPYLYEAMYAHHEGLPLETIDQAALDFGMPMGPVELADVVGLDVCKHVGQIVSGALGRAAPDLTRLEALVAAKKLGRKSNEGFYVWQDGKARKAPVTVPPPADLQDRLILSLLNESAACLREGIVADADLVDAAIIFGSGFAPFRGGPLHHATTVGKAAIAARLQALAARYGTRFTPDAYWSA